MQQDKDWEIFCGDCLEITQQFENNSIDAIITDLPYGTTACKWDSIIPLKPMWEQVKRLLKEKGVFITTAIQPFASVLISSNLSWFRCEWIWDKKIPSGMSYARYHPMRQHESVLVFGKPGIKYNPQIIKRNNPISQGGNSYSPTAPIQARKSGEKRKKIYTHKNPTTIIKFMKIRKGSLHHTQKPVELYEYLIKTYTDKNDTVLDIATGSGTTGEACLRTKRKFIGVEIEQKYYDIAYDRLSNLIIEPEELPIFQQNAKQISLT